MDADVIIYYHLLRQLRHSSSLDKVGSFLHKPWNQGWRWNVHEWLSMKVTKRCHIELHKGDFIHHKTSLQISRVTYPWSLKAHLATCIPEPCHSRHPTSTVAASAGLSTWVTRMTIPIRILRVTCMDTIFSISVGYACMSTEIDPSESITDKVPLHGGVVLVGSINITDQRAKFAAWAQNGTHVSLQGLLCLATAGGYSPGRI